MSDYIETLYEGYGQRFQMDRLLHDSEQRAAMAAAGLARVRERYCWTRVGEAYEQLLADAISARC